MACSSKSILVTGHLVVLFVHLLVCRMRLLCVGLKAAASKSATTKENGD